MNQPIALLFLLHINQSVFVFVTVRVPENTAAIQCQQHRFPDGGAEPPAKKRFGFYHNSTALFIIWCLATRPNNWIVYCKRSNESFGKRGHIDTVVIVPPAHPGSSSLQGGNFKISDPSHDNGNSRKSPSLAVVTHKSEHVDTTAFRGRISSKSMGFTTRDTPLNGSYTGDSQICLAASAGLLLLALLAHLAM